MAGSQGVAMAVAVSNAGGLGSLPCALLTPEALRESLLAVRAGTNRPYNVNFFCHAEPTPDAERYARWVDALRPYAAELGVVLGEQPGGPARRPFDSEMLDVIAEFRPPVVSFHFGLPSPALVEVIHEWGGRVFSSATTIDEARWLAARGVDAVIAQGLEAGGHRGFFLSDDLTKQMGTMALVSQIRRVVDVPVIAAGGIAHATHVAAVLTLGADAAQVGTAFLLCPEATTSAVHRRALRSDGSVHTALTNIFTGRPARSIVNRVMRELGPISPLAPMFPLAATAIAPLRTASEARDIQDFSPLWCGQNATGCTDAPAAVLTQTLCAGLD